MFSQTAKGLLYLKARVLEVYIVGSEEVFKIDFPAVVINHLEIVDGAKLNELIISFVAKIGLEEQKVVMLLSDEVVFYKAIKRDTPENEQQLIDAFFDKVPIVRSHLVKKIIPRDDCVYAIGTNKQLYQLMANSFENRGWQVEEVVPSLIFGNLPEKLDSQTVEQILSAGDLLKQGNFLEAEDSQSADQSPTISAADNGALVKVSSRQILVLVVALMLLAASILYALFRFGGLKNPFFTEQLGGSRNVVPSLSLNEPLTKIESSSSAESSGSAKSTDSGQLTKKEEVKIQILNGSGIAGQASKVKDQLASLGYANFDLGNSPVTETQETLFSYSEKVSSKIITEIQSELEKLFNKAAKLESSESAKFDIIIITGK